MDEGSGQQPETGTDPHGARGSSVRLALALAAVAAVGAGIAIQHILERRLSRPERARLRFYRYLRERGRLES